MREDHRELRVALKRRLPDETLVEHAAERVDVGASIDPFAGDLLGSDVVDGAQEVAVVADPALLGDPSREAEVRQVDVVGAVGAGAPVEQHVRGLHVAMHEAAGMGGIERARDLREDAYGIARLQATLLQALLQVAVLDVAHRDVEEVLGRPGLVDRDDVRMVDRRGQLRLTKEALAERLVLGEARSEQLERNLPLEPQILGQVDDAHAAPAQQRLDPIAGKLGADPGVVGHVHVRILTYGSAGNNRANRRQATARALQPCFRRATSTQPQAQAELQGKRAATRRAPGTGLPRPCATHPRSRRRSGALSSRPS